MNRVCGNYQELEQSVHGARGLRTTLLAWALWAAIAALALPTVGAAASTQPNPQQLWRQYPLDAGRSSSPQASTGGSTRTTGGAHPRTQSQPGHPGKSGKDSLIPWLAVLWAVCLLAALALAVLWAVCLFATLEWAVSLVRQLRHRSPKPKPRQRESAEAQNTVEAALRDVVRSRNSRPDRTVEPRPTSEYVVLKLKQGVATADPAEELRKKAVIGVPRDAELQHEVSVLKAKQNGPEPAEACHIAWSPGEEESRFVAMTQTPGGKDAVISSSPPFRWAPTTPPPNNLPRAVRSHAALVHELKKAGWTTLGRGEDWYSLELQRRPSLSVREGEA